jgi:hypothetical protein
MGGANGNAPNFRLYIFDFKWQLGAIIRAALRRFEPAQK